LFSAFCLFPFRLSPALLCILHFDFCILQFDLVASGLVWCKRCGGVTWGEHVPTVKEVDEQLAQEDLCVEHFSDLFEAFPMSLEARNQANGILVRLTGSRPHKAL
jgi:hypothetical protein